MRSTDHGVTDIDCGYCRKLHSEMEQAQRAGIRIRPVLSTFRDPQRPHDKAVSVWCADDRKAAMNRAKAGGEVRRRPATTRWRNSMRWQTMRIQGTPALILKTVRRSCPAMYRPTSPQALDQRSARRRLKAGLRDAGLNSQPVVEAVRDVGARDQLWPPVPQGAGPQHAIRTGCKSSRSPVVVLADGMGIAVGEASRVRSWRPRSNLLPQRDERGRHGKSIPCRGPAVEVANRACST